MLGFPATLVTYLRNLAVAHPAQLAPSPRRRRERCRAKAPEPAEAPEVAAVLAGVCTVQDGGTGAPRAGKMWGVTERDLGARRRPSNPFERAPSEAERSEIDCARMAGAAARR
jgi:hypothetical protein